MTGVTKTLEKLLGLISAVVLFLMMIITTVDVFGRYVLNKPLPGGFEMTEMALAVLIYAALPLVSMRREQSEEIGLRSDTTPEILVIVNRRESGITANMQGPLVINPANRTGIQIVLTDRRWTTRHELVSVSPVARAVSA